MNMKYEIKPLTEEEETFIEEKINVYADSIAPSEPHTEEEQLVFKVEDEDKNVAQLWVDGQYRHHGLGSMLIRAAENAAREKNCYYLCLGTADYMARPLYEKHGFHVFTINKDIPMGHVSWSLSKRLDKDIPDYLPTNNTAADHYQVKAGTKEDARIIDKGLDEFCEEVVPDKHEYITLSKKLIDADGNLIAAVICGIDEDDTAFVSYCCDWVSAFFFQNGFTPRGKLENYPKGHTAYELEKRI